MFIKKVLISHIFLYLFSFLLFPSSYVNALSLKNSIGFQTGSVEELVFEEGTQISKLIWNQYFLPQIKLDVLYSIGQLFFSIGCNTAIPVNTGYLEDFDYLTTLNNISHYSKHDLYVDKDYVIKPQISFRFDTINKNYFISSFIGFVYQNRKYSAQNGFLQYPAIDGSEWTGTEDKENLAGTVISYEQSILFPFIGITNTLIFSRLRCEISLSVFPYISIQSIDNHFLRLKQFYDSMNGYGGNIELFFVFYPKNYQDKIGFFVTSAYDWMTCLGSTASNNIGITDQNFIITENAGAGTNHNMFSVSLGLIINPFI